MSATTAGVVGAGAFGRHHARKYAEDGRVRLVGVYDPDAERAGMLADTHRVRAFDSLEALLAEAEIVTVATPPATHAEIARQALDSGRHVLVEKPLAVDPQAGADLVARAADRELVLACGHQERLVLEAIGLFDAPERPTSIESTRAGPWTGRSADVSVAMDLMIHDIDLALALLGEAPCETYASGRRSHRSLCDAMVGRARFASGASARFFASRIADARARSMRIEYESGVVDIDFVARSFSNTTPFSLDRDFLDKPDAQDPLGANVRRFLDAVLGEAPRPPVSGAEGLAALRVAAQFDARLVSRAA
jgi:predicted dehydrogenase